MAIELQDNFINQKGSDPGPRNTCINSRNVVILNEKVEYLMTGDRGFCKAFTMRGWIILVCELLLLGLVILFWFSILAGSINRKTTHSKTVEKVPSQLSNLTCYQCSWSVNVENKSPFPKERNCSTKPINSILCEPGDYCGLRFLEYFGTGSKLWERTCLKRAKVLNPGDYICIGQTKNNVNHTICRCNKELCLIQRFDLT